MIKSYIISYWGTAPAKCFTHNIQIVSYRNIFYKQSNHVMNILKCANLSKFLMNPIAYACKNGRNIKIAACSSLEYMMDKHLFPVLNYIYIF